MRLKLWVEKCYFSVPSDTLCMSRWGACSIALTSNERIFSSCFFFLLLCRCSAVLCVRLCWAELSVDSICCVFKFSVAFGQEDDGEKREAMCTQADSCYITACRSIKRFNETIDMDVCPLQLASRDDHLEKKKMFIHSYQSAYWHLRVAQERAHQSNDIISLRSCQMCSESMGERWLRWDILSHSKRWDELAFINIRSSSMSSRRVREYNADVMWRIY